MATRSMLINAEIKPKSRKIPAFVVEFCCAVGPTLFSVNRKHVEPVERAFLVTFFQRETDTCGGRKFRFDVRLAYAAD